MEMLIKGIIPIVILTIYIFLACIVACVIIATYLTIKERIEERK